MLRELEQLTFGTLHQGVDVGRFVERCRLELACIVDQLACQRLLGDDFRMILDVGRRANLARQSGDVIGSAHLFDHTIALQTVGHRQHVDRFLVECQFLDGRKDQLVLVVVERFGLQQVGDYRVGVLFEHKGTQHSLFHLGGLRLHLAQSRLLGRLCTGIATVSRRTSV